MIIADCVSEQSSACLVQRSYSLQALTIQISQVRLFFFLFHEVPWNASVVSKRKA